MREYEVEPDHIQDGMREWTIEVCVPCQQPVDECRCPYDDYIEEPPVESVKVREVGA